MINTENLLNSSKLNIKVQLFVTDDFTGCIIRQGDGIVQSFMPNGIVVSDLEFTARNLPVSSFQVSLIIEEEPLKNILITCSVKKVLCDTDGSISLFLTIDNISEKYRPLLENYILLENRCFIPKLLIYEEIVLDKGK